MRFDGRKAALHTLGCKVNEYETDAMRACLEKAGFSIVDFRERADVYVINTCSVTNIADRKSRQMISRARKQNPEAVVVAAGCYVQTALDRTGKRVEADILLGSGRKGDLVKELEAWFGEERDAVTPRQNLGSSDAEDPLRKGCGSPAADGAVLCSVGDVMREASYEELSLPRIEAHTRAWIKVQDGCNMFCSYCIIPYARGRIRSRKTEDVLREVKGLAGQGIREVVLTGIHLSSYGVDFAGDVAQAYGAAGERKMWQERSRLMDLIEAVSSVDGIDRIRLGSLEPTIVTEDFVKRLRCVKEICPHFHLSLQSGCDSVLKRMNRHYSTAQYMECVELLRGAYDRPAITTDVIVGFPGESEEEFDCTRRFLEQAGFYETHLFRYSMRAGTRAALMPDQVPERIKEKRLEILSQLNEKMRAQFERSRDGEMAEVLFEETARIDGDGTVSMPNSARKQSLAGDLPLSDGEKLYTGYTREYMRVFAVSGEDLRGKIRSGMLQEDLLILDSLPQIDS